MFEGAVKNVIEEGRREGKKGTSSGLHQVLLKVIRTYAISYQYQELLYIIDTIYDQINILFCFMA